MQQSTILSSLKKISVGATASSVCKMWWKKRTKASVLEIEELINLQKIGPTVSLASLASCSYDSSLTGRNGSTEKSTWTRGLRENKFWKGKMLWLPSSSSHVSLVGGIATGLLALGLELHSETIITVLHFIYVLSEDSHLSFVEW